MTPDLWGNSLRQWLVAGVGAAMVFGGLILLRRVLVRRLAALAARTSTPFDDILVEVIGKTRVPFLALVALGAGGQALTLPAGGGSLLRVLAILVIALQVALWGSAAIAGALGARARRVREADPAGATALGALSLLARLALYAVVLLLALDNLGIDVSALVAGLGIGGIAIALATQNLLGDLLASLSIVLDKPFVVGDFIVVGDLMGNVEHLGLKTTRVRSLSGEQLIFANADLLGSRIRNFKRMAERRVLFQIGVTYQTPHARLQSVPGLIREIIEAAPGTRFDRAHFKSYDDSALTFEVVYHVLDPDYNRFMDLQQQINLALYQRFESEGIQFAYPTRTVYLRPEPAALAGQAA